MFYYEQVSVGNTLIGSKSNSSGFTSRIHYFVQPTTSNSISSIFVRMYMSTVNTKFVLHCIASNIGPYAAFKSKEDAVAPERLLVVQAVA